MPTILYAASVAALILAPLAGVSILWAGALMLAGLIVELGRSNHD